LLLTSLYEAGVDAVAPGPLTAGALDALELAGSQRCWIFAAGKAAGAMAAAATTSLQQGHHSVAGGVVVAPSAADPPCATVSALRGDHPLPGSNSFAAAGRIGKLAEEVRSDDVAIVLLSGGASSLIAAPIGGLAEEDLVHLFDQLMASGLDIADMNRVRKRFTRWGAGRLALALAPARTRVLLISDVPGDDPVDVASGPCAPDPTTVHEVLALLRHAGLHEGLAPPLRDYLARVVRGLIPETPKRADTFAHVTTQVTGNNRLACDAVVSRARLLGLPAHHSPVFLAGDAARAGTAVALELVNRAREGRRGVVVWGGETTVRLAASPRASTLVPSSAQGRTAARENRPQGGRCQELALSAARQLSDAGDAGRRVTLLAAGTDGRDGPTDAAGGFADAFTWRAIAAAGRDPSLDLARHDSGLALAAGGALLRRPLTGTNVMDLVIGVIE